MHNSNFPSATDDSRNNQSDYFKAAANNGGATTMLSRIAGKLPRAAMCLCVCLFGFTLAAKTQPSGTVPPTFAQGTLTGSVYAQSLAAIGTAPITWSITSGTPPAGLSLGSTRGIISGTPVAPVFTFVVTANNAAGSSSEQITRKVTIPPTSPSILSTSLAAGLTGTVYSQTIAAAGTAPMTWSITGGTLPAGLTLGFSTGIISGTPTASGIFTPTITAANAGGSNSKQLSLTVNTLPSIVTMSLPAALTGTSYSQTLTATGTTPMIWAVTSGTLPAGLSLGSSTGIISGTPSAPGIFTPTITATNAGGSSSKQLGLSVNAPPAIVTTSLPAGLNGAAYAQTLTATGTTPMTWTVASGTLPPGLALGSTTGIISGTPTATGVFTFTVRATNAGGSNSAQLSLTLSTPVTVSLTPPSATLQPSHSQTFTATVSGTSNAGVTWSFSPALGSLTSSATNAVYVAPNAAETTQTVTIIAISVADPSKTASAVITLLQAVTLSLSPANVTLGPSGTQQFTASVVGSGNTAVIWSISPSMGTISATGLYMAPASIPASQTVIVTAQSVADPIKSASSTISLSAPIGAFTYYVDSSNGLDSNPGTQTAPWKTVAKVNSIHLTPGQSVGFKTGGVWREELYYPSSGSAGNPIVYGAYGSGSAPILSGSNVITGWSQYSSNVWSAPAPIEPNIVYFGNILGTQVQAEAKIASQLNWYWAYGVLYVWSPNGDPSTYYASPGIEAGARSRVVDTGNQIYVTLDGLTIRDANALSDGMINIGSTSVAGIVFQNAIVERAAATAFNAKGSTLAASLTINNCIIRGNGGYAIALQNQYTTSILSNNNITGNGWASLRDSQEYSPISGNLGNSNVFGNMIYANDLACSNAGQTGYFCHGVYATDSSATANIFNNVIYSMPTGSGVKAIGSANIYGNIIHDNGTFGIQLGQNSAANVQYSVYENVVYGNNLTDTAAAGIVEYHEAIGQNIPVDIQQYSL